jgi:hypothetical protein
MDERPFGCNRMKLDQSGIAMLSVGRRPVRLSRSLGEESVDTIDDGVCEAADVLLQGLDVGAVGGLAQLGSGDTLCRLVHLGKVVCHRGQLVLGSP